MTQPLKLMAVFPHPDDESLGMGGTLAKYAAEGIEIHLVCATRGERGWPGSPDTNPGLRALGKIREGELRCAAQALELSELTFLDYLDGDVDQADPQEITTAITRQIRRVQPQVVVTFAPDGAYGHPDHIALAQFTAGAIACAADASYAEAADLPTHRVAKLYYMVDAQELVEIVKQALGGIRFNIDGVERYHWGWPDWMITTTIDASAYWQTAWKAIQCHQSQLPGLPGLQEMPADLHRKVWGEGNYYRAYSLVNGGRARESDLFEGLR